MKDKENGPVGEIYNDGKYKENNREWHVSDSPWKTTQINKILLKQNLPIKTVCEVGCGAGEILKQLSLMKNYRNVEFTGYEVSSDAFEMAKQREAENLNYFLKDITEEQVSFDLLLCIDVFEHVEDYMGFLRKIHSKATYQVFHIPLDLSMLSLARGSLMKKRHAIGHLHYFTPETAVATLEDCGYKVIDWIYTPSAISLPAKSFKGALAKIPRSILYFISPKLLSTTFGGCSMMVLTK